MIANDQINDQIGVNYRAIVASHRAGAKKVRTYSIFTALIPAVLIFGVASRQSLAGLILSSILLGIVIVVVVVLDSRHSKCKEIEDDFKAAEAAQRQAALRSTAAVIQ